MPDTIFRGIFDSATAAVISLPDFLLCLGCALVLGLILTWGHCFRSRYSRSFMVTLALLPAVVCVVIMMVNGNVGAGVAVAGAFSLVRFRSVPGTAREITMLFLAMAAGLMAGMGYLGFSLVFTVIMTMGVILWSSLRFPDRSARWKTLSITIPEDPNYTDVFEPILREYADEVELVRVKTTNMGSLFRLTYDLTLKETGREKEMIDHLRCRNGNLEISVSRRETTAMEL